MYPGLLGEIVHAMKPHSEASSAGIAAEVLIGLGNFIGRGVFTRVGNTIHRGNEFLLLVGHTASGKGEAFSAADYLLTGAGRPYDVKSGVSSGEGIVHHVRDDAKGVDKNGQLVTIDHGVTEKRLLLREAEGSRVLKMCNRDGSVLSPTLRNAWDGASPLATLTKHNAERATGAHVSICAEITPADLRRHLDDVEVANGFANRFLYVAVARWKDIPNPQPLPDAEVIRLTNRLAAVVKHAEDIAQDVTLRGELTRTPAADARFSRVYGDLRREHPGLTGALLARGAPHVVRLSLLFAVLDQARAIDVPHLDAALAWWEFCKQSVALIFADRTGDRTADRIQLEMLPGERKTFSQIRDNLFAGKVTASALKDAVELLVALGRVRLHKQRGTRGRPAMVVERLGGGGHGAAPDREPGEDDGDDDGEGRA
jgi:hypothetical protein